MDQVIKLVAPVGGGGQSEPASRGDLFDGVLECGSRDVVAFVDDDKPIACSQFGILSRRVRICSMAMSITPRVLV